MAAGDEEAIADSLSSSNDAKDPIQQEIQVNYKIPRYTLTFLGYSHSSPSKLAFSQLVVITTSRMCAVEEENRYFICVRKSLVYTFCMLSCQIPFLS